jgi:hypothetical protein
VKKSIYLGPAVVKLSSPPRLISDDAAIVVAPDNAPVTLALPLKFCPQIVLVVCKVVDVPAFPSILTPVKL